MGGRDALDKHGYSSLLCEALIEPELRFNCPCCTQKIATAAKLAGHTIVCTTCGEPINVPRESAGLRKVRFKCDCCFREQEQYVNGSTRAVPCDCGVGRMLPDDMAAGGVKPEKPTITFRPQKRTTHINNTFVTKEWKPRRIKG